MTFLEKLDAAISKNNSLLCVGLDPDMGKLPTHIQGENGAFVKFCNAIVDATAESVCAFKPNSAFFEARGAEGLEELKQVCDYIRRNHPDIPIILDFKRGDIGNTNNYYVELAFTYLGVDAVTIQPYMGREAVQAFLDHADKGVIVLCRTSNSGSGELQDLEVNGRKLYLQVAENVAKDWNKYGNCLLVVGATYPEEMGEVRAVVGDDIVFLVPGIGAQGGDVAATVEAGANNAGRGLIINSARDILYQSVGKDFAEAAGARARAVRDEINQYRGV